MKIVYTAHITVMLEPEEQYPTVVKTGKIMVDRVTAWFENSTVTPEAGILSIPPFVEISGWAVNKSGKRGSVRRKDTIPTRHLPSAILALIPRRAQFHGGHRE